MKKISLMFAVLALVATTAFAASPTKGSKVKTFTGYIADSQCGLSHAKMLKMKGMGDVSPDKEKSCTLKCVEMGGKYVLADRAHKTVYQLDDQEKPKEFAGQKVKLTGTLDAKTKTIHVTKIVAA